MLWDSGVAISKGSKCCDLVNASYLWWADRAYNAFTISQHLRPFEIPTPVLWDFVLWDSVQDSGLDCLAG